METNPDLKKVYENMQKGAFTKGGFLGTDKRDLEEIIKSDVTLMNLLNLKFDNLTERMHLIINAGEMGLGEPIIIDKKWIAVSDETMSYIACPFEDGMFEMNDINVKNMSNNKKIIFNRLSIHLIKEHHFFQGINSPYRIDPILIKEILEL